MSAMEDFKEAFRVTKEQLEDKLYARMEQENEAYLAEIKTKPVDEIIAKMLIKSLGARTCCTF